MKKFYITILLIFSTLIQVNADATSASASTQNVSQKTERTFIEDIEQAPLILGNYDLSYNSLQGSVYELLNDAQNSILIISFTFSDPEVIRIVNQKASERILYKSL